MIKTWNIENITGYRPRTTFFEDFSIAEVFGNAAIEDTFKRAFEEWKDNTEYITELVMVLNWKLWEHYQKDNEKAKLYERLWAELDSYCMENLTGNDLLYFVQTTD